MSVIRYFRNPFVIAVLSMLTTAGMALADHNGRGRGSDGGSSSRSSGGRDGGGSSFRSSGSGGGGSSSIRSFSGGGGGDRSSSRSFSMGSGGNSGSSDRSSSRSFNFGGSGDSSPRSFSSGGNSSNGSSDRSSRSFGSSNDQVPRSLGSDSSGVSRILGNTTGDSSNSSRNVQSSDGGRGRSFQGFAGNNKGASSDDDGPSSSRSSQSGPQQSGYKQSDGRSNVDRAQLNAFLNNKKGDRTTQQDNNSQAGNTTFGGKLSGDAQRFQSGQGLSDRGPRNFKTDRPSGDQVRNFLNLPGNDAARLAENDKVNGDKGLGNNKSGDRSRNDNGNGGNTVRKLGDRDNSDNSNRFKFGNNGPNNNKGPGSNGPNSNGNSNSNNNGPNLNDQHGGIGNHDGKHDNHDGDNGKGHDGSNSGNKPNWQYNKGHNGDKEFHGKDADKHEFNQWSNSWKGKNGDGHDHRDWSGKWRDGNRFEVANHIRSNWWNRHDHDRFPFCGGWWGRGYGWGFWDDCAFRYGRPFYWWGWTTCPVLDSWCSFGWSTPYYWDYGPGEYIYCNNGVVYVNGAWYEPAPVFYQQTLKLIDTTPALTPAAAAQVEWLPLGVFAVTPDGQNQANVLAQLAVTKEGIIGGTVFDQQAGKSYTVQGTVDKNTQRAVWSYTNEQNVRVVMETSVNNLTQNESTGLVHYGPNEQKVVEIVRLQDPSGDKPAEQLPVPPQPVQ